MISERSLFLHYLRFLSAIIVCLGHTKEFLFLHRNESTENTELLIRLLLGLGSGAVLVFFFLSGYLVGGSVIFNLLNNQLDFKAYIFNRLTRLWIVLIPAMTLTLILNALTCRNTSVSLYCTADLQLASRAAASPQTSQKITDFFANIFFLQPFKALPWGGNGPLWSLGFEFWYYIVFFSIISILGCALKRNISFTLIPNLFILYVGARILNMEWIILGIIWLAGAFIAYLIKFDLFIKRTQNFQKTFKAKFTLLTCIFLLPALICYRICPRILSFPILILLLTFCLILMQDKGVSKMHPAWQKIIIRGSGYSFSLYLIHFPLIAFISSLLLPFGRWSITPVSLLVLVVITLFTLLIAYIFAWLTEFNLTQVRNALRALAQRLLPK